MDRAPGCSSRVLAPMEQLSGSKPQRARPHDSQNVSDLVSASFPVACCCRPGLVRTSEGVRSSAELDRPVEQRDNEARRQCVRSCRGYRVLLRSEPFEIQWPSAAEGGLGAEVSSHRARQGGGGGRSGKREVVRGW